MSTLANQIEVYLKKLLSASESGVLELKRSDLAEMFMCVPSQINYVLDTRFFCCAGLYGRKPAWRRWICTHHQPVHE